MLEANIDPIDALPPPGAGTAGINIGGDTVTRCSEHLPDHQRLLVRWIYNHAREQKLDWAELEQASKLSTTTLYRIWTDKYRYPKSDEKHAGERISLDNVCDKIARFKRIIEQRESIVHTGFVETSVWRGINWLCERSFTRQKIGYIYGESQIGKTTCLLEHTHRNNSGQTTYVEMPPASGVQLMTRHIAKALHVAHNTNFDALIEKVVGALDESKLLVIDEIHRVFTTYQKTSVMRCLDVLRYIHDKTRCGMVLCGTNVFRDNLKSGEFFQYLKQLRRRGLYELQLPAVPQREDLDMVARTFGLDPEAHDVFEIKIKDATGGFRKQELSSEATMLAIAKADGFGKYIIRLTDAAEHARKHNHKITWEDFVRVHATIQAMSEEVK